MWRRKDRVPLIYTLPFAFTKDRLTEANTDAAGLLEELNQATVTITNLRERLEQADNEVSRHRSELEQFMLRAQSIAKVDDTTSPSLIAVFDCLLAGLEGRIQSVVEERKREEEGRVQSLTSSFEVKVSGLEEEMQRQVEVSLMGSFPTYQRTFNNISIFQNPTFMNHCFCIRIFAFLDLRE